MYEVSVQINKFLIFLQQKKGFLMARTTVRTTTTKKSTHTYRFGNCDTCNKNLKYWGKDGSNGQRCPPCVQKVIDGDLKKREAKEAESGKWMGIFVDEDGKAYEININQESIRSRFKGENTCMIYRNATAFNGKSIAYMAFINDFSLIDPKFKSNARAESIIRAIPCFKADQDINGPLIILGPLNRTLFDDEIAQFLSH